MNIVSDTVWQIPLKNQMPKIQYLTKLKLQRQTLFPSPFLTNVHTPPDSHFFKQLSCTEQLLPLLPPTISPTFSISIMFLVFSDPFFLFYTISLSIVVALNLSLHSYTYPTICSFNQSTSMYQAPTTRHYTKQEVEEGW